MERKTKRKYNHNFRLNSDESKFAFEEVIEKIVRAKLPLSKVEVAH